VGVGILALLIVIYLVVDTISGNSSDDDGATPAAAAAAAAVAAAAAEAAAAATERERLATLERERIAEGGCVGSWSPCTSLCENTGERTWRGRSSPSCHHYVPAPASAAPSCTVGEGECADPAAALVATQRLILCNKPPTPTGYVFGSSSPELLTISTSNAELPNLVSSGAVQCDSNYSGTITIPPCSSAGEEWAPTGCTLDECTEPTNTTGYVVTRTVTDSLEMHDFNVPGIACAASYQSDGVNGPRSEICGRANTPYTLRGCESHACAAITCGANATCTETAGGSASCVCDPGFADNSPGTNPVTCSEIMCTKPSPSPEYTFDAAIPPSTPLNNIATDVLPLVDCAPGYHRAASGIGINCPPGGGEWTPTGCVESACTRPVGTDVEGYIMGGAHEGPGGAYSLLMRDFNVTGVTCDDSGPGSPATPATASVCLGHNQPYILSGCLASGEQLLPECLGGFVGITTTGPRRPNSRAGSPPPPPPVTRGSCNQPALNAQTGDLAANTTECSQRYMINIASSHAPDQYIQCQQRANNTACDTWLPDSTEDELTRSDSQRQLCREPSRKICAAGTYDYGPWYFFDGDQCQSEYCQDEPTVGDEVCECPDGTSRHVALGVHSDAIFHCDTGSRPSISTAERLRWSLRRRRP
jgi:hypothetical protein